MIEFILLFFYRILSGAQNGAGYAKRSGLRVSFSITLFLLTIIIGIYFSHESHAKLISIALMIVSLLGVIGVEDSFDRRYKILPTDIHFWENFITGGLVLSAFLSGYWIAAFCSVYPGLILHKGFINIGAGLSFFDKRTDDPTGKTYSIPLLKKWLDNWFPNRGWLKEVKIPREPQWVRLVLAFVSVVIIILYEIYSNVG